jgi:hypothetical protein
MSSQRGGYGRRVVFGANIFANTRTILVVFRRDQAALRPVNRQGKTNMGRFY